MKDWWRRVRPNIAGGLIFNFVRLTGRTLKIKAVNYEKIQALDCGKIICGWHGKSFVATSFWRGQGVWVIISQSRDGEIQNRIFQRLGFKVIRGSTGRGGVRAAVEGIKVLKEKATMAITPDGPRGPSGVVQGGVMLMAQKSGAALVPIGISARPRVLAKSWDRYMIPGPFAKAVMIFGEPLYVPKDATEEQVEAIRLNLEVEINRLEKFAEDYIEDPVRKLDDRARSALAKLDSIDRPEFAKWLEKVPTEAYELAILIVEARAELLELRRSAVNLVSNKNRLAMRVEAGQGDAGELAKFEKKVEQANAEVKCKEVAFREALLKFGSEFPEFAEHLPTKLGGHS